ncbi:Clavaminate synthase-like protein [Coniochaeta ligniaria NRRL 30616]|uniref:Clavaminate synthase-like protein n=1 Tax=Coniochaeta ligniaria NRRL 30616 TaxID=1408157 RepID=A0A1J7ILM6_9PEZI|nr:Clavaminate synthase-like protein [Coniochaeta ligniaria NRRL 30616]
MTAIETQQHEPATTKLWLRSYEDPGFIYRHVSTRSPRDCTPEEIPVIDLTHMFGDVAGRQKLAAEILHAAETSGFFYIKSHGVPEATITGSQEEAKKFFYLPEEVKLGVKADPAVSFYGYQGPGTRRVDPGTAPDTRESFNFHYQPKFDPVHQGRLADVPKDVTQHIPNDDYIWNDVGLPKFQSELVAYWQSCLSLARQLVRILAVGLDLPEDYFDRVTTYPGSDLTLNFYPGYGDKPVEERGEVELNAHTDMQILTLLWQSEGRGLQILNTENEWIFAPPIPGTFVVNIGDFLMRLTNDRLKSTIHRVKQNGKFDRYSTAFFFGFNFNEKCGVVPTCVTESMPAKYQPVTCGELIAKRLAAVQQSES